VLGLTQELPGTLKTVKCSGHFPGTTVLHHPAGANGQGILFSGDTIQVAMNRQSISFNTFLSQLASITPKENFGYLASHGKYKIRARARGIGGPPTPKCPASFC